MQTACAITKGTKENEYPHILSKVTSTRKATSKISATVLELLKLPVETTEYVMTVKIWECLYNMFSVLSKFCNPGCCLGNLRGHCIRVGIHYRNNSYV